MLKADLCFFKNQSYVGGHACLVQSKVVNIIHSFTLYAYLELTVV